MSPLLALSLGVLLAACVPGERPPDSDAVSATDTATAVADGRADNLASRAGDFALDFLRDDVYDALLIEVDYIQGHAPTQDALDGLVDRLSMLLRKPAGIEVIVDDAIPSPGGETWTVEQARDLEGIWRDHYRDPEEGRAVMYALYLDAEHDGNTDESRVLGYAHHGSSMVLFAETVRSLGGPVPVFQQDPEETVLAHEGGHLLGLVDLGIDMVEDHRDEEHGAHCDNQDCLMYWAIATDSIVDHLFDQRPDFDEACRADLEAAGGLPQD